jgi:predicted MFS family arabinose efflux permease
MIFILAEPIKNELHLNDTQLGLLGGLAFTLVYGFFNLPIAWLADRRSPTKVIGLCLLIWSAMTTGLGFAANFFHLLVGRFGVAMGEAGSTPPAHAIIGRVFSPSSRARAIAVFSLGSSLGAGAGLAVGGWLSSHIGWRSTFIALGVPGILLALVFFTVLRLPPNTNDPKIKTISWGSSLLTLMKKPAYRHLTLGAAIYTSVAYSGHTFFPAFLVRAQGLSVAEAGFGLGLLYGLGGAIGILLGGYFGDKLAERDRRWRVWIGGIMILGSIPFVLAALYVRTGATSIVLLALPLTAWSVFIPPMWAAVQDLAEADARATATALFALVCTGIFGSTGPVLIGMVSDKLTVDYGPDGLRYALLVLVGTLAWAGLHFFLAARHIAARPADVAAPPLPARA